MDDLRHALPALILANNLFGVEIDPRAAQIAALALWLRAQRAYREYQMPAAERPRITRTHIVVAEPMPGDGALVETFADDLQPPLLGDLFRRMTAEMRLAGELGTLLRVDDAIATTLTRAREEYVRQATTQHLPGLQPERRQEELDFSEIDDVRFFEEAEAILLNALRRFSESAGGGGGVRRWLFADDAAQGIALIELVRRRFDVVLMNPPFGACSLPAKKEFEKSYPRTKNDLYAAFVERGIQLLEPSRAARSNHLANGLLPVELPEVARGDSAEGSAASRLRGPWLWRPGWRDGRGCRLLPREAQGWHRMKTIFLRALEADDKADGSPHSDRRAQLGRRHGASIRC